MSKWVITYKQNEELQTKIFYFDYNEPTQQDIESIINDSGIILFMHKLYDGYTVW